MENSRKLSSSVTTVPVIHFIRCQKHRPLKPELEAWYGAQGKHLENANSSVSVCGEFITFTLMWSCEGYQVDYAHSQYFPKYDVFECRLSLLIIHYLLSGTGWMGTQKITWAVFLIHHSTCLVRLSCKRHRVGSKIIEVAMGSKGRIWRGRKCRLFVYYFMQPGTSNKHNNWPRCLLIWDITQSWISAPVQEKVRLSDPISLNGFLFLWLLTGIWELLNQ